MKEMDELLEKVEALARRVEGLARRVEELEDEAQDREDLEEAERRLDQERDRAIPYERAREELGLARRVEDTAGGDEGGGEPAPG